MSFNRKDFLKIACATGGCICGFSALAIAQDNSKNQEAVSIAQDNNLVLTKEWILSILTNLTDDVEKEELRKIIKKSAIVHYNNLKMDDMLKDYENNLEKFLIFIEEKWGWKIDYNKATQIIIADENKDFCLCPLINKENGASPAICYCSEGFAEKMFSKVLGCTVKATVLSSIQRGDKSCKYKIEWAMN